MKLAASLIVTSLILLTGCEPVVVDTNGRVIKTLDESCVNHVVYYVTSVHGGWTYSPKFKTDSTVETC